MRLTVVFPIVLRAAALGALLLGFNSAAWAKANGFPADACSGCHRGTLKYQPMITADPAIVMPGETTTLTLTIPGTAAGFYLHSNQKGVFAEIAGEGVKKVTDVSVTHTSPKRGTGGNVSFKMRWTAPTTGPGGVDFDVTAVSANGDGGSGGDSEGIGRFNFSFGCMGVNVYLDQDGDGFGLADPRGPMRTCEVKPGYTTKPGDCNDYDKNANPMGTEVCNLQDDDCDGMLNEGLSMVTVYRDEDGDGYGGRLTTEMMVGCSNGLGWSSTRDDCDDKDRMVNPGRKEMCNYKDDNCNGRVDEGVRPICGVGWCRREASSCEPNAACTPNTPKAETCNGFDEDCDGVDDNGATCPTAGNVCYKGLCVTGEQKEMMMAAEPPKPDGGVGVDAGGSSPMSGTGGTSGNGNPGSVPGGGSSGGSSGAGNPTGSPSSPVDNQPKVGCVYGGGSTGTAFPLTLFGLGLVAVWGARRRRRG
ncbi:MAG TPA: choice-of-anchor V domain-containing protein [Polyangia bacterium]